MNDPVSYRGYQPGDETAILQLYHLCYGRPMALDLWRWQHSGWPTPGLDIELAWATKENALPTLVGHGSSWPTELVAAGQRYAARRTQNIMVHPDYRRGRIMTTLLDRLAESNRRQGVDCWYAFPTRPAAIQTLTQTCGFSRVTEMPTYERANQPQRSAGNLSLGPPVFTADDARLIEQAIPPERLHVPRTPAYLAWRYTSHPLNRYHLARRVRAGQVTALCVYKIYEAGQSLDVLELGGEPREAVALLDELAGAAAAQAGKTCLWAVEPFRRLLEQSGFSPGPLRTMLVYRPLSPRCPENFAWSAAWYLSQGDSDVY